MFWRRLPPSIIAALLCTGALRADGVKLAEAPLPQSCVRNELTMELDGKITVKQDGKELTYPHKASAKHVFVERYLDASGDVAEKAARFYTTAESTIRFNNNEASHRTLRAERKFLVAQRVKDQLVAFSPKGPLTREEMEVADHFDTLAVSGLLPGKMIDIGRSWTVSNRVVAALCELDGLTEQNLEGTLESVKEGRAHVKIVGNAKGINLGAEVSMIVNAKLEFDVHEQRIFFLEWKETDNRQQGPVSPAMSAELTIKLKRLPIEEPAELNKFALVPIPTTETPPANLVNIHHLDPKKRFELSHGRDWHVVSPDDAAQFVMRQLERGEFIAQATLTPWKKIDPAVVMNLDDFAGLMAKTPGWAVEKEIERKKIEMPAKGHHTVYRVAASGELNGVRTVQYFYLIVGSRGDQLVVIFSVVPQHVQRLGGRDLEMVREIAFPE